MQCVVYFDSSSIRNKRSQARQASALADDDKYNEYLLYFDTEHKGSSHQVLDQLIRSPSLESNALKVFKPF